jgi:hypothetical protein
MKRAAQALLRPPLLRPPLLCQALLLALATAGYSCAEQAPITERYTLELLAVEASQDRVADVRLWADGRDLGVTDERGLLRARLEGRPGHTVSLTMACPPEYRTVEPERRLSLQRLHRATKATPDFRLSAGCERSERRIAIVVRTRGAAAGGMPVESDGQLIGQTEADGTAHLLTKARPHGTLRIGLRTARQPELIPSDPVHTFQLEDEDEVLLVDQWFARPPRPATRKAPPPKPPTPPSRPIRIE